MKTIKERLAEIRDLTSAYRLKVATHPELSTEERIVEAVSIAMVAVEVFTEVLTELDADVRIAVDAD